MTQDGHATENWKVRENCFPDLAACLGIFSVILAVPLEGIFAHPIGGLELAWDISLAALFGWLFRLSRRDSDASLWVRIVASFPAMTIAVLATRSHGGWIAYLPVLRLVYVPTLYRKFRARREALALPSWVKSVLIILLSLSAIHLISCTRLYLHTSVASVAPASSGKLSGPAAYVGALYWTISTISTGDASSVGVVNQVFTIFVMLFGMGIYSLMFGQAASLMSQSSKRHEESLEKVGRLTALLGHYEVPEATQDQFLEFYRQRLRHNLSEDEERIVQELPHLFQTELRVHMNVKHIAKIGLFKGCSRACLLAVAEQLKSRHFGPGSAIIERGTEGHEMYLLAHGSLEVRGPDGKVLATLEDGACVGEMALIGNSLRTADVTAVSHCDLYVLEASAFERLVAEHADLGQNVRRVVNARKSA